MKYHVNIIYNVEVTGEERLKEVVSELTQKRSFAEATVEVTGYNVNRVHTMALGAPESD